MHIVPKRRSPVKKIIPKIKASNSDMKGYDIFKNIKLSIIEHISQKANF